MQNCFFALTFYDDDVNQVLTQSIKIIEDKSINWQKPTRFHMTILYCYSLEDYIINSIDIIKPKDFYVHAKKIKTLDKNLVMLIESNKTIAKLHIDIKNKIQEQNFDKKSFIPHITLAHNYVCKEAINGDWKMPVKNIVLLQSNINYNSYKLIKKF